MVTLISQDGESFELSEAAASLSRTVALSMEDDDCAGGNIPLPNVDAKTLAKILEYLNKHAPAAAASGDSTEAAAATSGEGSEAAAYASKSKEEEEMKSFDAEFIDVDLTLLYNLFMAANYLDIKGLLDLCAQKVADMIKGKKPEEVREIFGIKNDFTPEEEAEIRKENAWAFE
ncbi:hypothetical protein BRADI_3g38770v3 [Brachypodium distachyon]|uniref:SKP1-like protein n=2 Tax=Brachypodium distachyon TaxID=15368 RepID=A0A0Q3M2H9_BRADI|nr:hypothetical protein BRADI_3g38770v3 [Brachypodium distachyon]